MIAVSILLLATATCRVEQAQYRLASDPTVTAEFHAVVRSNDWPNGVALRVLFGRTGRSYWFLPWQGGTDGRTNAAWVREKGSPSSGQRVRSDIEILTTDRSYRIDPAVPRAGRPAPAHMLFLNLRSLTWYGTPGNERDDAPRAFFDNVGCRSASSRTVAPEIQFPPVP